MAPGQPGRPQLSFFAKKGIACTDNRAKALPSPAIKVCGDALSGKVVEVLNKLDGQLAEELGTNEQLLGSWGVTFVAPNGKALGVPFSTKKEKKTAPGFISKRFEFENWLVQKLRNNALISLLENTEVRNYERKDGRIIATSKRRQNIQR